MDIARILHGVACDMKHKLSADSNAREITKITLNPVSV
jgi:hypothetical protein